MQKKFYVIAILLLILIIVIPIVIAALMQSKTIHISGDANYPINTPQPTVTPTSSASSAPSVSFSLWFPNGTAYPSAISGRNLHIYVGTGHTGGIVPNDIIVRNDGNVPISVNVHAENINVPSNILLTVSSGDGDTVVGVGQSANLYITIVMVTTGYTNGGTFSYSFDIVVDAVQA